MIFAFIIPIITILVIAIFLKCKNITTKIMILCLSLLIVLLTIGICIYKPQMHNRISLNVIDYLIKFNTDGSMTTTKQVTTEVIEGNKK